jgi:hypothetical protein
VFNHPPRTLQEALRTAFLSSRPDAGPLSAADAAVSPRLVPARLADLPGPAAAEGRDESRARPEPPAAARAIRPRTWR